MAAAPRIVRVRQGEVRPSGSWLYVWIDVHEASVAYVGGTGYDPELRAYLHLTSEDVSFGRVRASVPRYRERDFDVLAVALPEGVSRPDAKRALVAALAAAGLAEGDEAADRMPSVTDSIIESIGHHLAELR